MASRCATSFTASGKIFDWSLLAGGVEATLLVEVACRRSGQGGAISDVLHLEVNQSEGVC